MIVWLGPIFLSYDPMHPYSFVVGHIEFRNHPLKTDSLFLQVFFKSKTQFELKEKAFLSQVKMSHEEKDFISKPTNSHGDEPKLTGDEYFCFKTEKCHKGMDCEQINNCPKYHDERDKRRNPQSFSYQPKECPSLLVKGSFDFETSYCVEGDECNFAHSRVEIHYHPDLYDYCDNPEEENDDKKEAINEDYIECAHNQYMDQISKDWICFKRDKCPKGDKCEQEAIHCTKYHNDKDRRRDITLYSYSTKPCPHVWDKKRNEFIFEYPNYCYDECNLAHSRFEILYHPSLYKVAKCPYINDGVNLCPLYKTEEWFEIQFGGKIARFKRNHVQLKEDENGHKMRLALDYCPFAHDDIQKRSKDEKIIWNIQDHIGKHPHRNWYSTK